MILVADVGGTKCTLATFPLLGGMEPIRQRRFLNGDYSSFAAVVSAFLAEENAAPTALAVGVAGPVFAGRCTATNLPWVLDCSELRAQTGCAHVFLLNDLEAQGHALEHLRSEDVVTLRHGVSRPGNRALIAAGTGLGECIVHWDGSQFHPFATEGGHTGFAPGNELEIELLRFAQREHAHVSWERLVSGKLGFENLYRFLLERGADAVKVPIARPLYGTLDFAPAVSEAAIAGCPLAIATVGLFATLYGREAGDLALKALAVGGMYVGGGIAPKLLDWLKEPAFLEAFDRKGRFSALLSEIPVHVITNPQAALRGGLMVVRRALTV